MCVFVCLNSMRNLCKSQLKGADTGFQKNKGGIKGRGGVTVLKCGA